MKDKIREKNIKMRKTITSDFKKMADQNILENIIFSETIRNAKNIMIYISTPDEPDTIFLAEKLIEAGKKVYAPRIDGKRLIPARLKNISDLEKGKYSIFQPPADETISPSELDAVILPGVSFTPEGGRLGRGGGYYDRFLSQLPESTVTIGLSYSFQIQKTLPLQKHDFAVNEVVTETRKENK